MVKRVTLTDCAAQLAAFLDGRLAHEELQSWARDAMMAVDIPPAEHEEIMSLLQDLSVSSPATLRQAAKHYQRFNSPLTRGLPKSWLQ